MKELFDFAAALIGTGPLGLMFVAACGAALFALTAIAGFLAAGAGND